MNLRVDLILPTEQRSASVISVKSLVRIAIIVVPLILVIAIAFVVVNMMQAQGELDRLKAQWKVAEPRQKEALKLRAELAGNQGLENRILAWTRSRTMWDEQLRGVQKELPIELQIRLTRLTISSGMSMVSKARSRTSMLVLQGTAFGENAEANVQALRHALLKSAVLKPFIESADVIRFESNPSSKAGKFDRLFQIDVKYKARKFE